MSDSFLKENFRGGSYATHKSYGGGVNTNHIGENNSDSRGGKGYTSSREYGGGHVNNGVHHGHGGHHGYHGHHDPRGDWDDQYDCELGYHFDNNTKDCIKNIEYFNRRKKKNFEVEKYEDKENKIRKKDNTYFLPVLIIIIVLFVVIFAIWLSKHKTNW